MYSSTCAQSRPAPDVAARVHGQAPARSHGALTCLLILAPRNGNTCIMSVLPGLRPIVLERRAHTWHTQELT
jgi:hypothetical protein